MKRFALLLLAMTLLIPAAAPQEASASLTGQCHYQYWQPWNNGDGTVRAAIDLYCTVAHNRESQACLYFYKYGAVYGPYCRVSGYYYGTEFDTTAIKNTYSSSACTVQAYYWMYDGWTGEVWEQWSSEVQLWRCPT